MLEIKVLQETLREQTGLIFNPCRRDATPRSKALFAKTGSILLACRNRRVED